MCDAPSVAYGIVMARALLFSSAGTDAEENSNTRPPAGTGPGAGWGWRMKSGSRAAPWVARGSRSAPALHPEYSMPWDLQVTNCHGTKENSTEFGTLKPTVFTFCDFALKPMVFNVFGKP